MKFKLRKDVRRSLIVGAAAIPLVTMAVVFQNCGRAHFDKTPGTEIVAAAKATTGPCQNSTILGVWFSMSIPAGDVMSLAGDCRGSSSYCGSDFAFSKTATLSGQLVQRVGKTNSLPGCPSVGDHVCDYELIAAEQKMHFRCDGGPWLDYDMFSPIEGGAIKAPPPPTALPPAASETTEVTATPPPPTPASPTPPPPPAPTPVATPTPAPPVQQSRTAPATREPAGPPKGAKIPLPPKAMVVNPGTGSSKLIFVSSSPYSGNLGGIAGADLKCQSDPGRPASVENAKAILSDGFHRVACANPHCDEGVEGQADWVLKPMTTYRDTAGQFIGTTNSLAIFPGPMLATPALMNARVWTGLKTDWSSSSENCSSWAQTLRATGMFGTAAANATFLMGSGSKLCDGAGFRILCVEQ